jgi:DNA-binding beta-propeller fold protein YncE
MDDQPLHDLLDEALVGEPPIGPAAQKSLAAGIQLRRRRRIQNAATAAAAAAVAVAIPVGLGAFSHTPGPAGPLRPSTLYIYASNVGSGANAVTPVNTATNTPGKPIHVGVAGMPPILGGMIVITPDGKTVYVTYGTNSVPYGTHAVIPISTATNTPGKPIYLGRNPLNQPYFIAVTPNGKTAYVTAVGSRTVTPISTATNTPGRPIYLGGSVESPGQIVITADGKTAYVDTRSSQGFALTPISTATNTPGRPIQLGRAPNGQNIVFTPDGKTAYVTTGSGVTPISTATGTPGKTIDVGVVGPNQWIAITPDGKTVYVSTENGCRGEGQDCTITVTPISTATNTPGKPIHVGSGPLAVGVGQIAITPDGKTAYVTTGPGLTPISTATDTPGKPIKVSAPSSGRQIVFTPDGKTVYVTTGSGVTPISTATGTPGKPIHGVGNFTQSIAITP